MSLSFCVSAMVLTAASARLEQVDRRVWRRSEKVERGGREGGLVARRGGRRLSAGCLPSSVVQDAREQGADARL